MPGHLPCLRPFQISSSSDPRSESSTSFQPSCAPIAALRWAGNELRHACTVGCAPTEKATKTATTPTAARNIRDSIGLRGMDCILVWEGRHCRHAFQVEVEYERGLRF